MRRIQQLPSSVVAKIAAGEVIERPASVLKELLENAIDAGSTRIDIDVEQGGVDLIQVVDDGCGMTPDDLPLAFSSHATSKLADADDLFRIGTLGFRGEALASIGGVAQVSLQSRAAGQPTGAEINCNGGQLCPLRPWNGATGTRVEVRHLFYNVPVRRKFLRTTSTEMGHLSEAFTRIALCYLGLHLTLRHNGKLVYDFPSGPGDLARDRLRERIGIFFGKDVREQLYAVDSVRGPCVLSGFIADPACERGNARSQYLYVNGRWVRDRTLGHAIQEAYRGLLMTGRYAVSFLFLEIPPELVDVNVHPTKVEVRFQNSQILHHLVFTAVRDRLRAENLTPRLQAPPAPGMPQPQSRGDTGTQSLPAPEPWSLTPGPPPDPGLPFTPPRPSGPDTPLVGIGQREDEARDAFAAAPSLPPVEPAVPASPAQSPPPPEAPPAWPKVADLVEHDTAKVIQLYNAYLVVETPEGMLVIDQHALHERILFEQFKKLIRSGPLEAQQLLIPEPVELTAEQAARVLEHREELLGLGLGVEDFGGGTVLVTGYPAILGRRPPAKILKAVVDHLMTQERLPTREVLLSGLLSLMACHAAVRSGDRLNPEEMTALIAQRTLVDDTHHCPHGRPTALLFSRQELDRQFRRV
jgi:DNA mismatch repair protein MutL